ncbi:MAG: exopolysaccharide biosynthesis WecB/TagA/CpsF family protein [Paraglaciecola sp.]|jgi:exopolysaccharide biosynthesis WecB/TagA/CpsF family protein
MLTKMTFKIVSDKETFKSPSADGNFYFIDIAISFLLLLASSPILLFNLLIAKAQKKTFLTCINKKDCLGRPVILHRCQCGFAKDIALLWSVFRQNIRFCGLPLQNSFNKLEKEKLLQFGHCSAGLISLVDLHQLIGLAVVKPYDLIEKQASAGHFAYFSLLVKGIFSHLFFRQSSNDLKQPAKFKLFGLIIYNDSMRSAVQWALSPLSINNSNTKCKIGYFVNANTVNLTAKNSALTERINNADRCFADGSGMRLAAKSIGVGICENINGTDMLPYLCAEAQKTQRSIYLLGSKPGVADKAAQKLLEMFPDLNIAGTQDGYFKAEHEKNVITRINQSGADVLLVAMGSPAQEEWIEKNAAQLQCTTALGVGGLFDFYSGNIARAPMCMRELGMEWVWRLLQEPKAKFHRYVIGNPLFLIHTFIFNRAKRGF